MEHPISIVTSCGHQRLGMATLLLGLLMQHKECMWGGFYEYDCASNRLILSGKSFDYDPPRWNKVMALQVPDAYRNVPIVYRDHWGNELYFTRDMNIKYY